MRAFVAVTDNEWFRFLAALPGVDEVNFWQPSARTFRVLQPGEPLLFKLHAPESYIVGGGFFVRWSPLPYSTAWEVFEEKNGAATIEDMRRRIERYRRVPPSNDDYEVGCIVLTQPSSSNGPTGSRLPATSTRTSRPASPTTLPSHPTARSSGSKSR